MKRKVCFVTGSRAEYGLLRRILRLANKDPEIIMQLIVTGTHLSAAHGNTIAEIEEDGFLIDATLEILNGYEEEINIGLAISKGIEKYSYEFSKLSPDIIVVLGDRYEALSAATAALAARIPIAHIHGGESTEGLIDEAIRHAITKMSHVHFVATEQYARRVIQLGEQPKSVHIVGGLGVDAILNTDLLSLENLSKSLDIDLNLPTYVVTFHPETLNIGGAELQMQQLLAALHDFDERQFVFTMPNSDHENEHIYELINTFVHEHKNAYSFNSLGILRYLSLLRYSKGVIGNSSSGILEAPSFKIGTINIGARQQGRIQAESIINCSAQKDDISSALRILESPKFQNILLNTINPYQKAGTSETILRELKSLDLENILLKVFFEVKS